MLRNIGKNSQFIAIEGTDGAGKTTHTQLLGNWLKAQNRDVELLNFPNYGQPAAYFIEQYLNGHYGDLADIGPYRASLFYALERFDTGLKIQMALDRGAIVISDRYIGSNLAHQGGKITGAEDRQHYFDWDTDLEYRILGIPRPDLNIVLFMPSRQGQAFVDQRAERGENTGAKRDIHEASIDHLKHAMKTFRELCQTYPESFMPVECFKGYQLRSINEIQAEIRQLVTNLTNPTT